MGDTLLFPNDNQRRIEAVQKSFGPTGARLVDPKRVLIGEGRLMKQSRRGPQPKAFFLFNDVLVYGSIVINGRWFKKQNIIPLGDIQLEDLEDGYMRNQWLIKTPGKSFYVSAASQEEKQAWIEHIEVCKTRLPSSGRPLAMTWIPDHASAICMRCSRKFTATHRRHHCRKCGFLVCGLCSRKRAVIGNLHPTKRQRVCRLCHSSLSEKEGECRERGNSTGGLLSDEDEQASFEDHLYEDYIEEDYDPASWAEMDSFAPYVYLKPEHVWPRL
ncbi:pleckstrin homology domain-containing family F member 2-like [Boleophthalmus pectinirostris]|uniref:pleckstrin homology domain-containing family F member 2-like n=1 Tax=Boleophthalmus pectinirostris TaxID=150288 RepID=UPI0024300939|nr:pleckstrin homology domain-containing family F member 2-like [Boleophthalmus pectinirostris]